MTLIWVSLAIVESFRSKHTNNLKGIYGENIKRFPQFIHTAKDFPQFLHTTKDFFPVLIKMTKTFSEANRTQMGKAIFFGITLSIGY